VIYELLVVLKGGFIKPSDFSPNVMKNSLHEHSFLTRALQPAVATCRQSPSP